MITRIDTVDYDYVPEHSVETVNYFKNRHTGFIIAELKHKSGFEYYQATEDQMTRHLVGNYLGAMSSDIKTGREAGIMPYTEMHVPRTIHLDDEYYIE